MPKSKMVFFQSEGDFEITLLHENQSAFRDIISEDLFLVSKSSSYHQVMFHSDLCYKHFFVNVWELISERRVHFPDESKRYSLFSGIQWLREKYPIEA